MSKWRTTRRHIATRMDCRNPTDFFKRFEGAFAENYVHNELAGCVFFRSRDGGGYLAGIHEELYLVAGRVVSVDGRYGGTHYAETVFGCERHAQGQFEFAQHVVFRIVEPSLHKGVACRTAGREGV